LHIFASPQIKNQATLVGNVANASPIGDTIPYLMVSDALVCLQSSSQKRQVKMSEFYLGYKKLDLKLDEIITGIKIPQLKKDQKIKLYKISMRKDLDISAVTFAGLVSFDQNKKLTDVRLALGGVAATVLRLTDIEQKMLGEEFSRANFVKFGETLPHSIAPLSDLRASKEYRMLVAQNFFKKFFDEVSLCQ
jgi:xanthine dehydrogenase small subunit